MASEQTEGKSPANRNSSAESKQGNRRKRKVLLIVIPLLLALAAAAGLAVAYRIGMRQHNGPQGTQVSRIARGNHNARGDTPIPLLHSALTGGKAAMAPDPDV